MCNLYVVRNLFTMSFSHSHLLFIFLKKKKKYIYIYIYVNPSPPLKVRFFSELPKYQSFSSHFNMGVALANVLLIFWIPFHRTTSGELLLNYGCWYVPLICIILSKTKTYPRKFVGSIIIKYKVHYWNFKGKCASLFLW